MRVGGSTTKSRDYAHIQTPEEFVFADVDNRQPTGIDDNVMGE